jgi:hypothetical protein
VDAEYAYADWLGLRSVEKPDGFASFVDRHITAGERARWAHQLADLKQAVFDAENWRAPLSDTTIAEAVAGRIDYALVHGDTIAISTRNFSGGGAHTALVPGLVGDHTYSVVGIERGDSTKLVLDDPHGRPPVDANRTPISPIEGIEYGAGGIVRVDIAHLNKFKELIFDGSGAHVLYGPGPTPARSGPGGSILGRSGPGVTGHGEDPVELLARLRPPPLEELPVAGEPAAVAAVSARRRQALAHPEGGVAVSCAGRDAARSADNRGFAAVAAASGCRRHAFRRYHRPAGRVGRRRESHGPAGPG